MVFVADEIVTAAKLNLATSITAAGASSAFDRTFTNTSFLDLDALTGGAGTMSAVALTVTTGSVVVVTMCAIGSSNSAGLTILSFRISGATTLAAADANGPRQGSTLVGAISYSMPVTVTPGSNTFELQARNTAGTGRLITPTLIVHTI